MFMVHVKKSPTWGSFAICLAVSHRSLTMEAWVLFQFSPCGICGIHNATGKGFSRSTVVYPCHFHSIHAPYAFIHLSLILYNFSDGQCILVCMCAHAHTHTPHWVLFCWMATIFVSLKYECMTHDVEVMFEWLKWWRMGLVGDVEGMRKCKLCVSWEISRCTTIWMLWNRWGEILKWIL
jgi:hypothetical protein